MSQEGVRKVSGLEKKFYISLSDLAWMASTVLQQRVIFCGTPCIYLVLHYRRRLKNIFYFRFYRDDAS